MSEGNYDNFEDNHSSANTSLSGLTGYEEQLSNLGNPNLQILQTDISSNHKHECCSTLMYETRIKNLNIELQNSLKLNEKYKNDLFSFECKVQLENHERVNILIARNAQLEGRLEFANKQIDTLLKQRNLLGNEAASQNSNVNLQTQIDFLQNELVRCNSARHSAELQIKELACELQETKEEKQSRMACIEELKKKICEQHANIQNILQDKAKIAANVSSIKNDLAWCHKSESWYKEQLHACQMNKSKISEENLTLQQILAEESRKNDVLKVELSKWNNRYDELFVATEKTKEMLQRRIEQLEFKIPIKVEGTETNNDLQRTREYYETVVQDLGEEIVKIKQEVARQNEVFQKVTRDNSALVARVTTLQKSLNNTQIANERLEIQNKELNNKLTMNLQNLEDVKKEIVILQMEKQDIQVKLVASAHEKKDIENTVTKIRNDFSKVVLMHKQLKNELHEKEKNILQLQSEKQSLFMSNNWRICEMEQLKNNVSKIHDLENVVRNFQLKESEMAEKNQLLIEQSGKLRATVDFLQESLFEKENKLKTLDSEKQIVIAELYKKEESINTLNEKVKYLKKDLQDRDVNVIKLQKEVEELTSHCHILSTTKEALEKDIIEKQAAQTDMLKRIEDTNKSLCDRDDIICKLQRERKQLKSENRTLGTKNEELGISNSTLKQQLSKFITNNNNYSVKNGENNRNLREIFMWIFKKVTQLESNTCFNKNDFTFTISSLSGSEIAVLQDVEDKLYKISCEKQKNILDLAKLRSAMKNSKIKIKNVRKEIMHRLENMTERCHKICRVNKESSKMLDIVLQQNLSEEKHELQKEIVELKAVVKAREFEMTEKIKKYAINNRTLLKKAKEHMRRTLTAEKHNLYLQQLYDSVCEENGTLQLERANIDCDLEKLRLEVGSLQSCNGKLQESLFQLEKKFTKVCMEKEAVENKWRQSEMQVDQFEKQLVMYRNELQEKEELLQQVQELKLLNAGLQDKNAKAIENTKKMENQLQAKEKNDILLEEVQAKLSAKEIDFSNTIDALNSFKYQLEQLEEKNQFLSKELEMLTNSLQLKDGQIQSLQAHCNNSEAQFIKKESNFQSVIISLRSELQMLENELNSVKNDKYFLQRLCSDLKYALQSSVNQNKVLKERIVALSTESREYSSLPSLISSVPSPSKYDDTYINKLLQQSLSLPKPLSKVQGCLNSLKNELNHLQRQVNEKKFCN